MKFDVIVIGGGLSGFAEAMKALQQGSSCALISEGRSLDKIDYDGFVHAGGVLMLGDSAVGPVVNEGIVCGIHTGKLGDTLLQADQYILASGRFFSCGLTADMESVQEPLFGLDLDFDADRSKWFKDDFFADQPFMKCGVVVDSESRPSIQGVKIQNLKVVGSIVSKN